MNAHPDNWPTVTLTKAEFASLREAQYPRSVTEQVKRSWGKGWLRGTLTRQEQIEPGKRVDHILWEHIWLASL